MYHFIGIREGKLHPFTEWRIKCAFEYEIWWSERAVGDAFSITINHHKKFFTLNLTLTLHIRVGACAHVQKSMNVGTLTVNDHIQWYVTWIHVFAPLVTLNCNSRQCTYIKNSPGWPLAMRVTYKLIIITVARPSDWTKLLYVFLIQYLFVAILPVPIGV